MTFISPHLHELSCNSPALQWSEADSSSLCTFIMQLLKQNAENTRIGAWPYNELAHHLSESWGSHTSGEALGTAIVKPYRERDAFGHHVSEVTENTSGEELGGHWLVLGWRGLLKWCLPHTSLKGCLHKPVSKPTSPMPCFLIHSSFDIPNQPTQVFLSVYVAATKCLTLASLEERNFIYP